MPRVKYTKAEVLKSAIIRFRKGIDKTGECWLWTKTINKKGYGLIGIGGRMERVHRFSWELHNGPIPEGKILCHHCDIRRCARPSHLFIGTEADNTKDMCEKGRHPKPKLNPDAVRSIRRRIESGECNQLELSIEYGVTRRLINNVVNRKAWKNVE